MSKLDFQNKRAAVISSVDRLRRVVNDLPVVTTTLEIVSDHLATVASLNERFVKLHECVLDYCDTKDELEVEDDACASFETKILEIKGKLLELKQRKTPTATATGPTHKASAITIMSKLTRIQGKVNNHSSAPLTSSIIISLQSEVDHLRDKFSIVEPHLYTTNAEQLVIPDPLITQ